MEIKAANTFIEIINGKHTDIKLSDFGLLADELLPYISASPDKILLCSCCEKACVEIKRSYSNLEYLRLCHGKTLLKKSQKYYTLCMLQMAVTGTIKNCFVWNPHGMIIDEVYFDNEF